MSLMQDPPFGLLAFTPKRHSIWASAIYVLCRILLRAIGLHPEAMHDYIWKWSYFVLMEFYLAFGIDWPSVIGVLDKGAPKRLSLFVKRRGESSAHCKWMPLGEMSPGLAKLSGPQHPLVSVLNFSQSKRPSAQSAEGIQSPIVRNAEGMESPFVWKAKVRAYLCELKSRRSPKKSPFVRKAEGMESPSAIMSKAS